MISAINQIELRHFRYFHVLAEELHYRKASEKLFISQSALSQQIKQLEDLLEVTLFDRNNKKVVLSSAGHALRKDVRQLLNKLHLTLENVELFKQGSQGEMVIGFVESAMETVVGPAMDQMSKEQPHIRFELIELTSKDQIKAMEYRELDVAFLRSNVDLENMHVKMVYEEPFMVVLPEDHPITETTITDLSILKDDIFILYPEDESQLYYQQVISLCAEHNFLPRVYHKAIHPTTIMRMVKSGMGVSILPSSISQKPFPGTKNIILDNYPNRTRIFAVWNQENENQFLQDFLELL